MAPSKNYYVSAFFWNTIQKIFNAIVGFVTVPLLLSYFGKDQYGIISVATACNAYMSFLDLGMNQGAVRQFSKWKALGKFELIDKVARTNLTFYTIISSINILILLLIGGFGEDLFSLNHSQFLQLRSCLYIIALFSVLSWCTTAFNQLLIAAEKIAYTAQVQCALTLLKLILIGCVFWFNMTLTGYFFFLTVFTASLIFPYIYKCKKDKLISSIKPANYWKDFRSVLTFSLALFALSLFQMTATQSRPIVLAMFSNQGPSINAEFRIIEVVPHMLIMLGGTFSSIFLPKTTELVTVGTQRQIENFAYKWTRITTISMNILCFPFMLCAREVLSAYVGEEYQYLSIWLVLWCITVLIQMHTTPGNSLILGYGRTKILVITTAITCVFSIFINALLCKKFGVGSAVIGYFVYVIIIIGMYYIYYYNKLLKLNGLKMFGCFAYPSLLATFILLLTEYLPIDYSFIDFSNHRITFLAICLIKSIFWLVPYLVLVSVSGLINIKGLMHKVK